MAARRPGPAPPRRRSWGETQVALSRTALESAPGGVITGARFQGLEQFPARSTTGGISYCIAGPTPYSLEFATDFDVICLLLGDIAGRTRFDDDRESEMIFRGETAAFHPGGGNVRVDAQRVRHFHHRLCSHFL